MNKPSEQPIVVVRGLEKRFGENTVLAGVDLAVHRGSIVTVLGRSGTGKSVLLKCVAGLLEPDAGEVVYADNSGQGGQRCNYLFQANALFDWLTAFENVALPLEQTTRLNRREIQERVVNALENLGLGRFLSHFPSQLSGGMQKRLALARALVTRPALVLFDEPTAGLDPPARQNVFTMIVQNREQYDFTALIVTHDVPEALAASNRIALLERGRIIFEGTPAEFSAATDPLVRSFDDPLASNRAGL
jgi:phospholipid/cholesterol/gamma-HCH transport system ATP-binding protein